MGNVYDMVIVILSVTKNLTIILENCFMGMGSAKHIFHKLVVQTIL